MAVVPPVAEVGRSRPRARTRALAAGRGFYVDDTDLPRQVHAAFLRSPHAAAAIRALDLDRARAMPGVVAAFAWSDLKTVCPPWRTQSAAFPGLAAPIQTPLADGRVTSVGEPVALILASSRALAEDALEAIDVDFAAQDAVADARTALLADAPLVHPELKSNLAWRFDQSSSDVDAAFAAADLIVAETFDFSRHTGVPLETRGLIASFEPVSEVLEVRCSHQMPHQLQVHLAELLGLSMQNVHVTAFDVGGGFGIKMHVYPDEIAVCAAAKLLGRPVKFIADRTESLASDVHAREHRIEARLALDADGRMTALDAKAIQGIGSHSVYPRSSTVETLTAMRTIGAAYALPAARAVCDVVFQNKAMTGQYRSVGHPIACAVTERLVEKAARIRAEDPLELRRRNLAEDTVAPTVTPLGLTLFELSHSACLDVLNERMDRSAILERIALERADGRVVGLGFALFVEMTAPGSEAYGPAGVPVSAADTMSVALEPDGSLKAAIGISEIGQGTSEAICQILSDTTGVAVERIGLETGRTRSGAHGGGAWGSRGVAIGGEAALQAGELLKAQILEAAASLLQTDPAALDLSDGEIVDRQGQARLSLKDLARTVHFRGHEFPAGTAPQVQVHHSYRRPADVALPTNGVQAALVEIDPATGIVSCRQHWVVHDCGRIVNPLLAGEQVRGGVVQGLGGALFEHCRYDGEGNFLDGSLADYLVPMAAEMPDIDVVHVETPYSGSDLGAKGAGEAGTCGASAAVLNAVNDALAAAGGQAVASLPLTPPLILAALDGPNVP